MVDKKVIFVAFAIEDETQRDFLKGQSLQFSWRRYAWQRATNGWVLTCSPVCPRL